jgi:hypothetical protein
MNIEAEIIQNVMAGAKRFEKKTPVSDGVVLLCGDSLTPTPVSWLWRDWLALGKVHILAGAPGTGKTTIAIAFAATITSGGRWPDGTHCEAGNVLVWSGEDDPADTLLPRLMAAGGNRSRVHFVDGTRIAGESLSFDPSRDMKSLQTAAEKIGNVRLILVDPIVSAVTGDSHKNTETRRALQPLVDLASNMNAVLLGITHFSKGGQGGDPSQRVLGSVAFTAVARVVLVAAKVQGEDGKDKRILARSKSNIGPDSGGFEYHLEQGEPLPGIEASYVTWGEAVQGSARELLTDPNEQEDEESHSQAGAADFLKEVLKDCAVCSKDLAAQAREAGIAWRTIRRASDKLGIIKRPAADKRWYWKLPNLSTFGEVVQLVQSPEEDNMDNMPQIDDKNPIESETF